MHYVSCTGIILSFVVKIALEYFSWTCLSMWSESESVLYSERYNKQHHTFFLGFLVVVMENIAQRLNLMLPFSLLSRAK